MDEGYKPGAGIAAGRYMLKWSTLDLHLGLSEMQIQSGDTVNVFINFESVLRNLALNRYLQMYLLQYKQQIVIELESAILNLIAHYKLYFSKKLKCNVKLYYYYTDLVAKEEQEMQMINPYYRSYYKNRYMQNPQFREVGKILTKIIIPEIELIISYVPDCYFIKTKTFDSSLIPQIIANMSDAKNVLITGDIFDTLYLFNPNFITLYVKNRFQHFNVCSSIDAAVNSIIKTEASIDLTIFRSELYYRLLLSIRGSKIRNIKASRGFGYNTLVKTIKTGINHGLILKDFSAIDSIIQLFPEDMRSDIKMAFQCLSIDTQMELTNDSDIAMVQEQIVDKVDISSLESLNNKRFFEFPINLSSLI